MQPRSCPTWRKGEDSFRQAAWIESVFNPWADQYEKIIMVYGNHDQIGEHSHLARFSSHITVLTDKSYVYNDLTFYGTPWQRRFFDWSFNASEEELETVYERIPRSTDILISHGPPYGVGDQVSSSRHTEHLGSPSLLRRIEVLRPSLCVYGHIHGGNGMYEHKGSTLINAALSDEQYRLRQCAWMVTMNGRHVVNVEKARYEFH